MKTIAGERVIQLHGTSTRDRGTYLHTPGVDWGEPRRSLELKKGDGWRNRSSCLEVVRTPSENTRITYVPGHTGWACVGQTMYYAAQYMLVVKSEGLWWEFKRIEPGRAWRSALRELEKEAEALEKQL